MKQIILLNGPSSSGKSTLSKALVSLLKEEGYNFVIVSIDNFMKLKEDETIYEDDVYEISGDMCDKVVELLKTYDGVIVDHVITSERIYKQFIEMSKQFNLQSVHVNCPLNVLLKRERERGNRCIGSAKDSYQYLYPKEGYDLTVDTSFMSALDCAKAIIKNLK